MLGGNLMFGHQDDSQPADSQATMAMSQDNNNDDQTMSADEHSVGNDDSVATSDQMEHTNENQSAADDNLAKDDAMDNAVSEDDPDDVPDQTGSITNSYNANTPATSAVADDLLDIKQQALSQLSPIVNHLEQTPEEKFRTVMMMIQASDNQSLIQEAYAAAQQISDEKAKAQALLDVVNEINYFTHQNNPDNN